MSQLDVETVSFHGGDPTQLPVPPVIQGWESQVLFIDRPKNPPVHADSHLTRLRETCDEGPVSLLPAPVPVEAPHGILEEVLPAEKKHQHSGQAQASATK